MRILQKRKSGIITEANFRSDDTHKICDPCVISRLRRITHSPSSTVHRKGTHMSADYYGPLALGLHEEMYVATFIEHLTRHIRSYFLKSRREEEAIAALEDYLLVGGQDTHEGPHTPIGRRR